MQTIGLIAGVLLTAFAFYGAIWLVVCVIDRIVNDITYEVEHGLYGKEDYEDESTGFLETIEETRLHDFKQND